jgi:serine/threonine-protein kinase
VAVPDLTGRSFADAQAALDKLGLDSTKTAVTSTQPTGTVVDQVPKAGAKLAKGSTVTLSLAQAAQQTSTAAATSTTTAAPAAPMPDVSGQTEAAAVQAMGKAGLLASLAFVPAQEPLGTVVQQAKPAGTSVPFHTHVQINISRGPNDNPLASVPNVIGQTLQQAVGTLNGARLRLIYLRYAVTSRAQAGKIVQQSPLGGGQGPQNAQVVVYLGAFRQ